MYSLSTFCIIYNKKKRKINIKKELIYKKTYKTRKEIYSLS